MPKTLAVRQYNPLCPLQVWLGKGIGHAGLACLIVYCKCEFLIQLDWEKSVHVDVTTDVSAAHTVVKKTYLLIIGGTVGKELLPEQA